MNNCRCFNIKLEHLAKHNQLKLVPLLYTLLVFCGCSKTNRDFVVHDVRGSHEPTSGQIWLAHEHLLVDFVGADSIQPKSWNHDSVINEVMPYLDELKEFDIKYFVDATPNYLGRDVELLEKIATKTGLRIITNTGLYGARNDIFIPKYAEEITADSLAEEWIDEFKNGINGTSVRPGFIKIGIDSNDTLDTIDQKLVKAAGLTHLETGLVIASHTGKAEGLWPQLKILKEIGVSPESFIWVHAQEEEHNDSYLKAAEMGCWISLDGLGWDLEKHIEKILFAKENGILDRLLISHDAGWYDPQKKKQSIVPYTNIFTKLYPKLISRGLTDEEFQQLMSANPLRAFSIAVSRKP